MNKQDEILDGQDMLSRKEKESLLNQKGKVIWFTGLSGSGKTTNAILLEKKLAEAGCLTQVLDGDIIRSGINNNLGFSLDDRVENIRRIAEIAKLFLNCGIVTICCFISPTEKIRNLARNIIGKEDFLEVYLNTPIEECEKRDVKGLYAKARSGIVKDFTGIDSPFEDCINPYIKVNTKVYCPVESVDIIFERIVTVLNI